MGSAYPIDEFPGPQRVRRTHDQLPVVRQDCEREQVHRAGIQGPGEQVEERAIVADTWKQWAQCGGTGDEMEERVSLVVGHGQASGHRVGARGEARLMPAVLRTHGPAAG